MPTLNELNSTEDRRLHCSICGHVTELPGVIRFTLEGGNKAILAPFQCQTCGNIHQLNQLSDEPINANCECGGIYSVSNSFFCSKCLHGKQ